MAADAGQAMHARRCVLHSQREAAARCPGCKRFYCRECITEHEGKVLCSGCLAEKSTEAPDKKKGSGRGRMIAQLISALLLLFFIFFTFGILIQVLPTGLDVSIGFEEEPDS